jgi:pimeloyl-ACP methyl ester carboxylesterase
MTNAVAEATVVGGLAISALEAGAGRPLVVLHHSFGSVGWTPLLADLATDHAVRAPDLPGFGRSERPAWARTVRDLAILMGQWMRRGPGPAVVVGCGLGGWVAAEIATMAPELCSHLVLVGAAGLPPRDGEILDQMMLNHSTYVRSAFRDLDAYRAVFGDEITDEVLLGWDICREMVTRVTWKPYMYNRCLEPLLAEVAVPSLVVWGERDAVVPLECGERYAAGLAHARLEVVPGAGHAVDLEAPELLAALVRAHTA